MTLAFTHTLGSEFIFTLFEIVLAFNQSVSILYGMENITYQLETAKATLRGAMAAINSGELEKWEMKEFDAVRRECVANIRKWLGIKKEVLNG